MSQFSMDELRDMAPAYALGALSTEEKTAFENALNGSAELANEVAEFRAVVERLGTEQQVVPPPALRARFLERIAADKAGTPPSVATPPVTPPPVTPPPVAEAPARAFTVSTNKSVPASDVPKQRWWLSGALGAALAASLIFLVQRNSQVSSLTSSLAARDSVLTGAQLRLAQRDSTVEDLLEADSASLVVHLASTASNGPGVQVFWNVKQGRGVLHAFRLKPAAQGRAYQLWLIKDGKPVASRVFNSETDQRGLVWGIEMPTATTGVTALAITEEPAGGSVQPTTTPFIIGALPKSGL